jgi:hypothetical protein
VEQALTFVTAYSVRPSIDSEQPAHAEPRSSHHWERKNGSEEPTHEIDGAADVSSNLLPPRVTLRENEARTDNSSNTVPRFSLRPAETSYCHSCATSSHPCSVVRCQAGAMQTADLASVHLGGIAPANEQTEAQSIQHEQHAKLVEQNAHGSGRVAARQLQRRV